MHPNHLKKNYSASKRKRLFVEPFLRLGRSATKDQLKHWLQT